MGNNITPFQMLGAAGLSGLRSYEDTAITIGRLDAAAGLATPGLRALLVLRCAVLPLRGGRNGMIALLRSDREGPLAIQFAALLAGAAKARGGVVPTLHWMCEQLGIPNVASGATDSQREIAATIDGLLRDSNDRTPPVLKVAAIAAALNRLDLESEQRVALIALATTLLLCVGGATSDSWLTLALPSELSSAPTDDSERGAWLTSAFGALAREGRAIERGLAAAAAQIADDAGEIRRAYGRAAISALELHTLLADKLVLTLPDVARSLGVTAPTAGAAMGRLESLGIATEVTGQHRSRAFVYTALVDALAP